MGAELNQWVEAQLRKNGWSISELARRAGLSNSFVSHVLSGRHNPGAKFYLGMSKAFNLPVASIELLDQEGIEPEEEEEIELGFSEWMEIIKQLDRAERVELLKYAFRLLRGAEDDETTSTDATSKRTTTDPTRQGPQNIVP